MSAAVLCRHESMALRRLSAALVGAVGCARRAASAVPEQSDAKNTRPRLPKLMEILEPLPLFGVGARVSKEKWHDDSFWQVVDVHPRKKSFAQSTDGELPRLAAKIYGIKYWNGKAETGHVKQIRGQMKRIWRRVGVSDDQSKMYNLVDSIEASWPNQSATSSETHTSET